MTSTAMPANHDDSVELQSDKNSYLLNEIFEIENKKKNSRRKKNRNAAAIRLNVWLCLSVSVSTLFEY